MHSKQNDANQNAVHARVQRRAANARQVAVLEQAEVVNCIELALLLAPVRIRVDEIRGDGHELARDRVVPSSQLGLELIHSQMGIVELCAHPHGQQ
jgi:hypothetical protein